jgi:hypothetical protein
MSGLQLKFTVDDKATPEIKKLQKQLNAMKVSTVGATKGTSLFSNSLITLAGSTYLLNKAYDKTILRGLKYNNLLENQRNSIATLINVTSSNVSLQGKQLSYQDKVNLSLENSNELMKELTKLNANTPQTLGQTAQIFKTMYAPMQKVNASQEDMLYLTEKLAIASKVGGVEFNSLLAGVDGLASGTVLANSDLGRFLSSLGLTNDKLKKSDDVIGLLKNSLKDFKAFDDLDTAVSNLNVQWDTLTGNMTKDIFVAQKESVKTLTKALESLSDTDIKALNESANELASGLATAVSTGLRFANGMRIMTSDITTGVENSIDKIKIFLQGAELLFKETTRNIRLELVDALGFDKAKAIGIDTNFNKQQQEISKLESNIAKLKKGIINNNIEFEKFRQSALGINDIILNTESKFKEILKTKKEITAETKKDALMSNKSSKYLDNKFRFDNDQIQSSLNFGIKEIIVKTDLEIDIGSDISTAIIDGINGSKLDDIFKNFTSSIGNQMINKGVSGLTSSLTSSFGAVSPLTSLGAGIGMTALSGLLGGGSSENRTNAIDLKDAHFDTFIDGLNEAGKTLKLFGSTGSEISQQIKGLQSKITSIENVNVRGLSTSKYSYDRWWKRKHGQRLSAFGQTFQGNYGSTRMTLLELRHKLQCIKHRY